MPAAYLRESAIALVLLRSIYVVLNFCNASTERLSYFIACFVEALVRGQWGL